MLRSVRLILVTVFALGSVLASVPSTPAAAATFSDIADSKFRADIEPLAASGVTSGCGGGKFCPKGEVTREQMAAFLHRADSIRTAPIGGLAANASAVKMDGAVSERLFSLRVE